MTDNWTPSMRKNFQHGRRKKLATNAGHLRDLTEYIVITEPLLPKSTLEDIVAVTEGIEWRVPPKDVDYNRTCTTFPISMAAAGKYPAPAGRLDLVEWADERLVEATREALKTYKDKHPRLHTSTDEGFDILRYEKGQSIEDHVDDRAPRVLSMSLVLNDAYTGGEFRFWQRKEITMHVPAGCAIMFPPNFMFPHEVLPITSGTRYAMITWFR
jgi:hypothetical protein